MPYVYSKKANISDAVVSQGPCEQLPGTVLRIFIPAGAVINLLNLLEITSPSGICLIIRIPVAGGGNVFSSVLESIKAAGGSVELVK